MAIFLMLLVATAPACQAHESDSCPGCSTPRAVEETSSGLGFAVVGDWPYSPDQQAGLDDAVGQLNSDPNVDLVFQVGDIGHDGACKTSYYRTIESAFDRSQNPLIDSFGDDEWADCSEENAGSYDPMERLATPRRFSSRHQVTVWAGDWMSNLRRRQDFRECLLWLKGVYFAAFHAVGSNNGLIPWAGHTRPTDQQRAAVALRTRQAQVWINATFAAAGKGACSSIVLLTQADMFRPGEREFVDSYRPLVDAIAQGSAAFPGDVHLINGDSHRYFVDRPLAASAPWSWSCVTPAEKVARITVNGSVHATGFLKVSAMSSDRQALTWALVPFTPSKGKR